MRVIEITQEQHEPHWLAFVKSINSSLSSGGIAVGVQVIADDGNYSIAEIHVKASEYGFYISVLGKKVLKNNKLGARLFPLDDFVIKD